MPDNWGEKVVFMKQLIFSKESIISGMKNYKYFSTKLCILHVNVWSDF